MKIFVDTTLSFFFCYIIKPYIDNHFIEINNEIYNMLFKIANICKYMFK